MKSGFGEPGFGLFPGLESGLLSGRNVGGLPDGLPADGGFTDGLLPDGLLPEGLLPDGLLPDGLLPDGLEGFLSAGLMSGFGLLSGFAAGALVRDDGFTSCEEVFPEGLAALVDGFACCRLPEEVLEYEDFDDEEPEPTDLTDVPDEERETFDDERDALDDERVVEDDDLEFPRD